MADTKRSSRVAKKSRRSKEGSAGSEGEPTPTLSFEGALEKLEEAVARLEQGEMPLEEALELFESGIKLSRQCNTTLEAAERRIEILMADQGVSREDWRAEPFESELEDAASDDSEDGDRDSTEEDFED